MVRRIARHKPSLDELHARAATLERGIAPPHTTGRTTSISNGEGWAAGLAAADLALLDVNGKLRPRAG